MTPAPRLSADASRDRLIEAAMALYRQRPPDRVPLRELARAAGVNHGLIHRLFGGKQGLTLAVLRRVFRQTGEAIRGDMAQDLPRALARGLDVLLRERWLAELLAHAARQPGGLDGVPSALMTPIVRQHLGAIADHPEVAMAVAAGEAATLGWMLFEPLLVDKPGLATVGPEDRVQALAALLARQLEGAAARAGGLEGPAQKM